MVITRRDPVDWFRVIADLERFGYHTRKIATTIQVSRTAVIGWRNRGARPRHEDAEALIELWMAITRNGRETVHRVSRYSHTA